MTLTVRNMASRVIQTVKRLEELCYHSNIALLSANQIRGSERTVVCVYTGASKKIMNIMKKLILFQKVKLSYILDSLHVK